MLSDDYLTAKYCHGYSRAKFNGRLSLDMPPAVAPPLFVRKDLDGFFGLMIDNLIQLILIVSLCRELIHLPDEYIFGRILPGAAISILVGNFFYAWQARRLARETGREDVTALPYGINTVSLFAYVFFIMLPIVQETKDPIWAWKVGLVACFLNGLIEMIARFHRRARAPGDPARRAAVGFGGHRDYFYIDGFHVQDFRQAVGRHGADGAHFRRLLFASKTTIGFAWRPGGDRRSAPCSAGYWA